MKNQYGIVSDNSLQIREGLYAAEQRASMVRYREQVKQYSAAAKADAAEKIPISVRYGRILILLFAVLIAVAGGLSAKLILNSKELTENPLDSLSSVVADNPVNESSEPAQSSTASTNSSAIKEPEHSFQMGDIVTFTGTIQYTASYSGAEAVYCEGGQARITAINIGQAHPYHLITVDGGSIYGWVNEEDILPAEILPE